MKKNIFSLAILSLLLVASPSLVKADEKEAGEAAKLTIMVATAAAEPKTEEADPRVKKLEAYLEHYHSPLSSQAQTFIDEADRQGIDWRLVVSIAGVESTFGQFIPSGSNNPFGWGVFTGQSYGVNFKNWDDAIATVSQGLKTNYIDKGATSIESIGYVYASSPAWSNHVRFFMKDLDAFPTPEEPANKVIAMTL